MKRNYRTRAALALLLLATIATGAQAGPLRDRIQARMQERAAADTDPDALDMGGASGKTMSCAEWKQRVDRLQRFASGRATGPAPQYKDLAYGNSALETLDVFAPPAGREPAPIIAMVHGGGWCVGDKAAPAVTENKVGRWGPKGFVFVSINYPMVSDGSDALAQASHVARAVAYVQAHAGEWGGDPRRVILMGHSAGAHLVSLVNADARIRQAAGVRPLLGTVSLDAGAIDVVRQMPNVYPFLKQRYREAFGDAEAQWIAASPFHQLDRDAAPWLGVCSTQRKDDPCGQARAYADKSHQFGLKAAVLPQAKNHGAINKELGLPGEYTRGVETFMATLDPGVAALLK
jgi:acetyl esterase/lipase